MGGATRQLIWVALALGLALVVPTAAQAKSSGTNCPSTSPAGLLGAALEEKVPIELSTPLEAPLLASFGVLRRAAKPSDEIPALSPVGSEIDGHIASYYPAYVRELTVLPSGVRYYLVPGFPVATTVPPAACLPPAVRGERPKLVERSREQATKLIYCIAQLGSTEGHDTCTPFSEAGQSRAIFEGGALLSSAVELVPDGVGSVRFDYGHAPPVVEAVSENAFLFIPPHSEVRAAKAAINRVLKHAPNPKHPTKAQFKAFLKLFVKALETAVVTTAPGKLEWLDATGAPIRTILAPKRHTFSLSNL